MNTLKYDPGKRSVNMGPEEGKRFKKLGDFGEVIAAEILKENGFKSIKNLNGEEMNFRFADFYAEKDGKKYLISIKTRNKFENSGKLNSRYKLGKNVMNKINEALKKPDYNDCVPAWLAIAIEEKTYDAYFGLISDLKDSRGILMSQRAVATYLCLDKERPHGFDPEEFRNVYKEK